MLEARTRFNISLSNENDIYATDSNKFVIFRVTSGYYFGLQNIIPDSQQRHICRIIFYSKIRTSREVKQFENFNI